MPVSTPHAHPNPPLRYQRGHEVDDDDASDDELDVHDLKLLNTDYAAQRDLSFHPIPHQQRSHYQPSIPSSLRQQAADEGYDHARRDLSDSDEWGEDPPVPRRKPSQGKTMFSGGNDYQLPQHNARAYQDHRKRKPLIDLIRNEWKTTQYKSASSSPTSSLTPTWIQVLSAPRLRRYVLVIFGLLSLIWGNWHYWGSSQWNEHKLLTESLKERMRTGDGWFGENMRPEFLDMVHVKTLDQGLIPQKGDAKRLIVIGDVHGCHDELVSLLAEAQYEARSDHLIFAGDFISKGPSSAAVVDLAMSAHSSCVRGNHEDRVLLAYRDIYSHRMTQEQKSKKVPPPPMPGMPEDMPQNESPDDVIEEENFEHGDLVNRQIARSFTKRQIDYIAACPVILDVGKIKGMGDVHIVHAGLIPGVRLEKQDPMSVMHMRTVDLETHVPSSSDKGTAWYKLWNKYQTLITSHQRSTVIYGHDSRRGLQIHKYSKGLDTGCVRGGKLTALVIDNNVQAQEARTMSVPCKDHREPKKERVESKKDVE